MLLDELKAVRKAILQLAFESQEGHIPSALCISEAVSAAIKKAQELDYDDYSTRLHSFLDSSAPLMRWASDRALLKLFA